MKKLIALLGAVVLTASGVPVAEIPQTVCAEEMISALEKKATRVVAVDTDGVCGKLGSAKVANMVLLGAACREGLFSLSDVDAAMKKLVKADFYELNKKALESFGKGATA